MTIGEALVSYLETRGVEVIFGIPGVHTIELYRGLAQSSIRHVTARHEQGVGFMADGYARASGRAGIAFVITGPGMTNMLTPMAQSLADSIPMLIISGVNETASQGLGLGHLHELPNQLSLCAQVAKTATQITQQEELIPALHQAFEDFTTKRPAPIHIQIPTDIMKQPFDCQDDLMSKDQAANIKLPYHATPDSMLHPDKNQIIDAVARLTQSNKTVILAGGGAKQCTSTLEHIAEALAAPVVLTGNARGLMHQHPLCIPASPSLEAVRALIREADCILAVGTEIGFTDYDVYRDDGFPVIDTLIRIDICADQLVKYQTERSLQGDANHVLAALLEQLEPTQAAKHTE
ncbi:MAG: thiamine pyrophosphate-binding protein, partial [Leucothrix sp.]